MFEYIKNLFNGGEQREEVKAINAEMALNSHKLPCREDGSIAEVPDLTPLEIQGIVFENNRLRKKVVKLYEENRQYRLHSALIRREKHEATLPPVPKNTFANYLEESVGERLEGNRNLKSVLDLMREMTDEEFQTLIYAELTTQEAADILNMSRPTLIKLLDSGDIPHSRTGNRRKVAFVDVMSYKQDIDAKRLAALDELTALDQKLGLGYE